MRLRIAKPFNDPDKILGETMRTILLIILFATAAPNIQAQQHQARNWHCVRQPWVETTDGNVVVLRCVAALPKDEKLDADDEDTLTKLDIIRHDAEAFNQPEPEMMNAIRMGFGQKVGQLCQKHTNIVLAPMLIKPSNTTTLYGCKNIIAAPDK
jgi:hypothetical protein